MLKRIITGILAALVMVFALFGLNTLWFSVFTGILVLWAAWEWLSFSKKISRILKLILIILMGLLLAASGFVLTWIIPIGIFVWIFAIVLLLTPMSFSQFVNKPIFIIFSAFLFLIPAWCAVVYLQQENHHWGVVYVILITALADTGAYFSGRFFGKRLMAPQVSPKKTLEGALGGIILASLIATLWFEWVGQTVRANFGEFLLISIGLVFISIFGDLFESLLKRHCGVKDSGVLLPGHGGILDRIDSVIAVLPVFAWIEMVGKFFA